MKTKTPNERRREAGYCTGARKEQCGTCAMVTPSKLTLQASRNDRHCAELDAPVKASGTCNFYLPGRNADMPEIDHGELSA